MNQTVGSTVGAVVDTVSGGVTSYTQFSTSTKVLVAGGTNNTVAAIGSTSSTTVIGGSTNTVVFVNNSTTPSNIYLGGGNNYVGEGSSGASAVINVDGSTVSGTSSSNASKGGAYVAGSQGATTINLYTNSFVYLNTGSVGSTGQDVVVGQAGNNEVLGIGGSSTVPVTVTAGLGSSLYVQNSAAAFINPSAGYLVLSGTGTTTMQAGSTGSETVFGGTGIFYGGSLGNNILLTSTVAGATTIVGGGNNDLLGSFGNSNVLWAGSGNETLVAFNAVNDILIGGSGSDTLLGSASGQTFIGFGAGHATAIGTGGTNTYFQAYAGGTDTITDFLPGQDVFSLALSSQYESQGKTAITVSTLATDSAGTGTLVTLSDGTTIDFLKTTVTRSNFT